MNVTHEIFVVRWVDAEGSGLRSLFTVEGKQWPLQHWVKTHISGDNSFVTELVNVVNAESVSAQANNLTFISFI